MPIRRLMSSLRGWKEIAAYTGLSKNTIKKLMDDPVTPFPICKIMGQYMMTKKLYDEYIENKIDKSIYGR